MNNNINLAYLVKKTEDILKRKDVTLTLSQIARDHYTKKLYKKYSLDFWFKKDGFQDLITSEKLILTAYALELAGINLISSKDFHTATLVLSHAAKIFEYTGTYLDLPRSYSINLLRHAAVCYDAGGFPSNSFVMSNKVLEDIKTIKEPMETIPRFIFKVNFLIYSFLARNFSEIDNLHKTILAEKNNVEEVIKTIKDEEEQYIEIIRFIGLLESAESIYNFYRFLLTGEISHLNESTYAIDKSIQIFLDADDSEYFTLMKLIAVIMEEIQKRSVWKLIQKYFGKNFEYMKLLVNSEPPIVELWVSQIEAIRSGLLDKQKKNFIISMPTSAGKTLIAELAILKSLNENLDSTCIYIAPNKALALQIEKDFLKRISPLGIKVSLVVGSYDYPEIETLKLKNCRVLITTPEKLSLLLKRKEQIILNCNLFVLDEAQTLQTGGDRGIHIEFLLIRISKLLPESKIILLSAVMNNPDEIAEWIEEDNTQVVSIDWHPTRTLQAILHNGVVEYFDDLQGLTLAFPEAKRKSNQERAVILAKAYQSLGPVLIFCNTKSRAEDIANMLNKQIFISHTPSSLNRLKQLANRIRAQFGSDFALAKNIENGIAYHHADLPSEIRSDIEGLVRKGDIQLITSTTTLAEGINTPVSTVIMPYLNFQEYIKGRWKWTPLTKMLYKNIAGRAGRALENTEGHVILLKTERKPLAYTLSYLNSSRDELEPVESALKEIVISEESMQTIDFNDKKVIAYQTEILSTICEQILQEDEVQNLVDLSFFSHNVSKLSKEYNNLLIHTDMQIQHLHNRAILTHSSPYMPTELGKIYNETGLSPESCELLLNEIELLLNKRKHFKIPIDQNRPQFHRWLQDLLSLVFVSKEVRISDTYQNYLPNEKILLDWIFGKSTIEIAKEYFIREKSFDKAVLKAYAYSYVQLSYYAPWVLWSIIKLLDYKEIECSWPIRLLPAFAKYGTHDIVAVYCSALGISSRKAASILAQKYREEKRKISFEAYMNWLHSLDREDISKIILEKNLQDLVYLDIEKSKEYISSFI